MKKTIIPSIIIVSATVIVGIIIFAFPSSISYEDYENAEPKKQHEYVWSGPIATTKNEYRIGENVYFIVSGLLPDEKGTINVFTPEGIVYKTIFYDGSKKSEFNQYFFPDTFAEFKICTPDQLVGTWNVVFEDNSYPPLEFQILNETIRSGETLVTTVC